MSRVEITPELVNRALAAGKVRSAVDARARILLPRAQRIALEAGAPKFAKRLRVERGVRPGVQSPSGIVRPYARVAATVGGERDWGAKLSPQRILRRAS